MPVKNFIDFDRISVANESRMEKERSGKAALTVGCD